MPTIFLFYGIFSHLLAVQGGDRIAANIGGATLGLTAFGTVLSNCRDASTGDWVKIYQCATLVLASTIATGLAAHRYHTTGTAFKKREDLINLISSDFGSKQVEICNGSSWMADLIDITHSQLKVRDDSWNLDSQELILNMTYFVENWANYNSSDIRADSTEKRGEIEVESLHAIISERNDGLLGIIPINDTVLEYYRSGIHRRDGYTGYDLTAGAITVYANSDPVCYWEDAVNWATSIYDDPEERYVYFYEKLEKLFGADYDILAVSLSQKWNGLDGQFIARSYSHRYTDWERGLNWCFGPYKSNCKGTHNAVVGSF